MSALRSHKYNCLQVQPPLGLPLVMLHGWGYDSRSWDPLLDVLRQWTQVITLDINYRGQSVESLCAHLLDYLPPRCLLVGWSLGGMLATRLACCAPQRVLGLVTLSTNIRFVASERWSPAMPPSTFDEFYTAVNKDPAALLQRFIALVALGDNNAREQRRWLSQIRLTGTGRHLVDGLSLLSDFDNLDHISSLQVPARFYFGEKDALVPVVVAERLQTVLGATSLDPAQAVNVFSGAGHLLHFPSAALMDELNDFLQSMSLSTLSAND